MEPQNSPGLGLGNYLESPFGVLEPCAPFPCQDGSSGVAEMPPPSPPESGRAQVSRAAPGRAEPLARRPRSPEAMGPGEALPARPSCRAGQCLRGPGEGAEGARGPGRGGCAGPGTRRVRGGEGAVRLLWSRFARAVSEPRTFHFPPP